MRALDCEMVGVGPAGKCSAQKLPSQKLTWKPKKGPTKTRVLSKGALWVSMLVWGSVPL